MNGTCFKAYDIRGKVPDELDEDLAYQIGCAYAAEIKPDAVVVGHDVRLESPLLAGALIRGLNDSGVDVIDIGLCGTEEVYFQTFHRQMDGVGGGIMVTASHNPKGYNGMKLVREGARPLSGDSGLFAIRDRITSSISYSVETASTSLSPMGMCPETENAGRINGAHPPETNQLPDVFHLSGQLSPCLEPPLGESGRGEGVTRNDSDKSAYITHLLTYVDCDVLKPLRIVANPGNGSAGLVLKLLEHHFPFEIIYLHDVPDGNFPHGVPNPLLPENREATARAVRELGADFGLAWDGDFDRCFFFDGRGRFIEGYYLVGLLAKVMLAKHPGAKIIHDPRLIWNTIEQVRSAGGRPIQSKTGHAFIKERMRLEDAVYGGEMSAHHYFRDFAYCDSGMIPWLLISELMSRSGLSLAELVNARMEAYPCSGEINYPVSNSAQVQKDVQAHFQEHANRVEHVDGLGMEFDNWRFNLRSSNTEPLLRLNVETRNSPDDLSIRTKDIESLIIQLGTFPFASA